MSLRKAIYSELKKDRGRKLREADYSSNAVVKFLDDIGDKLDSVGMMQEDDVLYNSKGNYATDDDGNIVEEPFSGTAKYTYGSSLVVQIAYQSPKMVEYYGGHLMTIGSRGRAIPNKELDLLSRVINIAKSSGLVVEFNNRI